MTQLTKTRRPRPGPGLDSDSDSAWPRCTLTESLIHPQQPPSPTAHRTRHSARGPVVQRSDRQKHIHARRPLPTTHCGLPVVGCPLDDISVTPLANRRLLAAWGRDGGRGKEGGEQWPHAGMRPEDPNDQSVAKCGGGQGGGMGAEGDKVRGKGQHRTLWERLPALYALLASFPSTAQQGSPDRRNGTWATSILAQSLTTHSFMSSSHTRSSDATTNTTHTPPHKQTATLQSLRTAPPSASPSPWFSLLRTTNTSLVDLLNLLSAAATATRF